MSTSCPIAFMLRRRIDRVDAFVLPAPLAKAKGIPAHANLRKIRCQRTRNPFHAREVHGSIPGAPPVLPGRRPDDVHKPGFGGGGAESRVDVEAVGGERIDPPAGAKRGAQLARGDPAGTPAARLAVAEAHEVEVATWAEPGVQSRDIVDASRV